MSRVLCHIRRQDTQSPDPDSRQHFQFLLCNLKEASMKTETSVRSLRKPALQTAGWLLLAITLWLFSAMASAQAQTQAPTKQAMPALFVEDTSPKALVPTTEAFREAVKTPCQP
jgi:hypothetical protein